MAKINGTLVLVYCDGTLIATQKSCTVSWEQDMIDTTNKSSLGWEEHINGMRRCTCDCDALYSTTGLSAEDLITYITGRTSCVLLIDGGGYPIVGEARPKNLSANAPMEDAASISGSFTFDGPAWMLSGTYANLMTDPDGTSNTYDTMTVSGISITSAIDAGGGAAVHSNTFSLTTGDVIKVITFLTLNSGELPKILLYGTAGASNQVTLVEGVNVITLTGTRTETVKSIFSNTAACNWSMTNIYLFKT